MGQEGRADVRLRADARRAPSDTRARRRYAGFGDSGDGHHAAADPGRPRRGAQAVMSGVREVVEVLAKALTDSPDDVRVTESQHKHKTLIELFVSPNDIGKLIGRQGRTAAALRTLAATAGEREGKDVTLEIREGR